MGQQRALAEWVAQASYHEFPAEVVSHAKGLLLKTIAGTLMGSREHIGPIITRYVAAMGGSPDAGVVAGGLRTSVEHAALANATMAHASELEDNQVPEQLSTFWVYPAFFPLAEKLQSSGRDLIEAAVISFEVFSRYGRALPAVEMIRLLSQVPPTWYGPVAVAAGAAKMLRLSVDQTETALSIAASQSCGNGAAGMPGTDNHFIESGITCRNGLLAALLAKEGATAGLGVLERVISQMGEVCFNGQGNPDLLTDNLGKPPYSILDCRIKKYSACTLAHPAVDALVLLKQEHGFGCEDVESIELESGEQVHKTVSTRFHPASLEEARFSTPFLMAEVLLRGRVDERTYEGPEKLLDPQNREAQKKVTPKLLADVPYGYPGARVTVVKKNGEKLVKKLEDRIGSPAHPLTLEQIAEVSRPFMAVMLKTWQCDRVEEIMLNLERQPDLLELTDLLAFCRVGRRT